jgi:4-amino-4-deoxy-L-arabinose transferase-like glycosyltransferase
MEPISQLKTVQQKEFFSPVLRLFIITFLFVTAFGIRLYRINELPARSTRHYHSMLIARGNYFETLESIPEWRKQVAIINKKGRPVVEPRLMEYLTVSVYRLVGGEYLWIPRLLSSMFWLIGGVFVYLLAKDLVSIDAAIFSAAFYLFLPFSVIASRSFQPDPLMVMAFLASLFAIFRFQAKPSTSKFVTVIVVSATAIFIKPVCLFAIFGAFISLNIYRQGFRRTILSPSLLVFVALSVLPVVSYLFYGSFIAGFLQGQTQGRIMPHLLLSRVFWGSWLIQIDKVIGYVALIGGFLGVLMVRKGGAKALLMGLWAGYFLFGLAFAYHIHTHDYYQLQFIPIIALSLGPIGALIINHLSQIYTPWYWRSILIATFCFAVLLSLYRTRWDLINPDFEREVKIAQEIGEAVDHSTNTIFLAANYGGPLIYHGDLSGYNWPQSGDFQYQELQGQRVTSPEERLNSLISNDPPEYFIVTDFEEFEVQQALKELLTSEFPIVSETGDYLIFKIEPGITAETD